MASDYHSGSVRKFKPELVETSTRSNKPQDTPELDRHNSTSQGSSSTIVADTRTPTESDQRRNEDQSTEKARRFLPQPTETTSRSSKKHLAPPNSGSDGKPTSDHVEVSQSGDSGDADATQKKRVRLLPQPVEVTKKNNKSKNNTESGKPENKDANKPKSARKFNIEPIETVKLSRRQHNRTDDDGSNTTSTGQSTPRKFAPQLIETGKRSHRRSETLPIPSSSRNYDEAFVSSSPRRPSSPPMSRGQQIVGAMDSSSGPPESRFSYASLVQRQEGRRHSFRVPDLPAIPSNSSEESDHSDLPSLSTSPSASSDGSANRFAEKTRSRESCDERFSGYLLSLAARSAEKQLRDQALAAFPNEQVHQPVSHFAIDGDEDFGNEDDPVESVPRIINRIDPTFRRASTADLSWELEEMRRHKEEAELKDIGVNKADAHESKFSAAAIASRQPKKLADEASLFAGWRRDIGLAKMRHAASPPMLGDDIKFVLSASPQGTSSETDPVMTNQAEADARDHAGLWNNHANAHDDDKPGLWMGLCHQEEGEAVPSPCNRNINGIATPRPDRSYFDHQMKDMRAMMGMDIDNEEALSDSSENMNMKSSDIRICMDPMDVDVDSLEQNAIDREFHDGFVTQVYNYLSLGYPSLARYYDHELSKISGIPVSDLRQDDLHTEARGHVVVSVADTTKGGNGEKTATTTPEKCIRWKALRLYIREWARQQPKSGLFNDEELDAWGVIERRGSWAI